MRHEALLWIRHAFEYGSWMRSYGHGMDMDIVIGTGMRMVYRYGRNWIGMDGWSGIDTSRTRMIYHCKRLSRPLEQSVSGVFL